MATLNKERIVQIDFTFLSAVLTKESILFQSRVNFFYLVNEFITYLNLCLVPIFNVSLHEFHFILLISLRIGSPGFISPLVSSGLPCNLTIAKSILVLYYILAK